MNEQDFFNRLVTFSFGGHDEVSDSYDVVFMLPNNVTAEEFATSYNKIMSEKEEKNKVIKEKLLKNGKKRQEISWFLKKYDDKEHIKEKAAKKIAKKEKLLSNLLNEYMEINKKFENIDPEDVIKSLDGIIVTEKSKILFVDNGTDNKVEQL